MRFSFLKSCCWLYFVKFISINSIQACANKQIIEDVAGVSVGGWLLIANLLAFCCSCSVPCALYLRIIIAFISQ